MLGYTKSEYWSVTFIGIPEVHVQCLNIKYNINQSYLIFFIPSVPYYCVAPGAMLVRLLGNLP